MFYDAIWYNNIITWSIYIYCTLINIYEGIKYIYSFINLMITLLIHFPYQLILHFPLQLISIHQMLKLMLIIPMQSIPIFPIRLSYPILYLTPKTIPRPFAYLHPLTITPSRSQFHVNLLKHLLFLFQRCQSSFLILYIIRLSIIIRSVYLWPFITLQTLIY